MIVAVVCIDPALRVCARASKVNLGEHQRRMIKNHKKKNGAFISLMLKSSKSFPEWCIFIKRKWCQNAAFMVQVVACLVEGLVDTRGSARVLSPGLLILLDCGAFKSKLSTGSTRPCDR